MLKYFCINLETTGFFKFEIIINYVLVSLIWIPTVWVYSHYKYFNSISAGTVFICQILTYKDGPELKALSEI